MFANGIFEKFVLEKENVLRTKEGFVPLDASKPAWIILEVKKYPWQFCGADIKAVFKTSGKVYIAEAKNFVSTNYNHSLKWQLLSEKQKEYGENSIEGKTAYWLKFEFSGSGSGLESAEIASEIQMSQWAMPGLEYGTNRIRFEARQMQGGPIEITYRYDDRSPYHYYEPATGNYGRHIPLRLGGFLEVVELKGHFWEKLATDPTRAEPVTVSIFKMTGANALTKVRILAKRDLRPAYYTMFWDGRDDAGNRCPPNDMYCYQIKSGDNIAYAERLYLSPELWPRPNETGPAQKNSE